MSYKERRTDLKDGLDKRPGFCWHPQGCNGDITVHMRVDVLQHAGPKRHATSPEDRREAWAELRWRRHGCRQPRHGCRQIDVVYRFMGFSSFGLVNLGSLDLTADGVKTVFQVYETQTIYSWNTIFWVFCYFQNLLSALSSEKEAKQKAIFQRVFR